MQTKKRRSHRRTGGERRAVPPGGCEFAAEIAEEIENRNRLRNVPQEMKRIQIAEKQSPKINFVKRK